eukprot:2275916-Alexandrium_andersonii.AAC.1
MSSCLSCSATPWVTSRRRAAFRATRAICWLVAWNLRALGDPAFAAHDQFPRGPARADPRLAQRRGQRPWPLALLRATARVGPRRGARASANSSLAIGAGGGPAMAIR